MNTYQVTVVETHDGPDAAMRERLARCAAFRLESLERRAKHYPRVGGEFDMLDHFEGRFLWERSDEEMVNDPPSRVDYEVVGVDPPEPPATPGLVQVQVRIVV
jgi:hypothetical protein